MLHVLLLFAISFSACSSTPKTENEEVYTTTETTLDPEGAKNTFVSANHNLQQRNYDAAIHEYIQSEGMNPEPWEVYMNHAIATILNGRTDTAIQLISESFKHGGDKHQVVYYNLGNIYQERGLYDAAIDAYRAGLSVGNKDDIDSLTNIAAAYLLMTDYEKATFTYQRIATLDPASVTPAHGLGLIAHLKDDYPKSIEYYDEVLRKNPKFAPTWFNRGYLYMDMEKYQEAVDAFEMYRRLAPEGPYVRQATGHIQALKDNHL